MKNHFKYQIYLFFDCIEDSKFFKETDNVNIVFLTTEDYLLEIVKNNAITDLFILDPSCLLVYSRLLDEFRRNKINLYIENKDFLKIHFDKYLSNLALKRTGIPVPKFQLLSDISLDNLKDLKFPIIIKPRKGYASRDIYQINNISELFHLINKINDKEDYLVQEYIYGDEFSCTIVKSKNNILNYLSVKRLAIKEYTIASEYKEEYSFHLADYINLFKNLDFDYAINIQYKYTNLGPVIFEVNPRLGTAETHRFEYNFDTLDVILSNKINITNFKEGNFIQT